MAVLASLRFRPFALLWTGQTISRLGDGVYRVALAWWVLEETGSAAAMGTVLIFSFTPMLLFLLIGGVMVDRLPRVKVLVGSDVLSGLIISTVAVLAFADRLEIWHVYVASMLFGFVEAFFFPAYNAIVPDLLPAEALPSANSLTDLGRQLTGVIGPSLGAILFAVGGSALAFGLNGLSFLLSAVFLLPLLAEGVDSQAPRARQSALRELRDGLATVAASPWIWTTIVVFGLINITAASPSAVALPFLVSDWLHADVGVLGLLQSLFSVGSVLAALWLGRMRRIRHRGRLAYGATILNGLATLAFGLLPPIPVIAGASLLRGLSISIFGLIWINTLQELVPREKLGRVYSLDALGSFVLLPVGYGLVGWATDIVGAPLVFIVGGAVTAALALLALLHPAVRNLD